MVKNTSHNIFVCNLNMEILRSKESCSVPKQDIRPISDVVLRSVEVAAVVQAASPVHGLPIEVLLMIGSLLDLTMRRAASVNMSWVNS